MTIRVRRVNPSDTTFEQLVAEKMGLYFPIGDLSQEQRSKLEDFIKDIAYEPVAVAHSKATDDD